MKKRQKVKPKPTKRRELTPSEAFQQAIKQGKILSRPIFEGDSQVLEDERVGISKSGVPSGYALLGVSQGMTFSETEDTKGRMSNWHRIDAWVACHVDVKHIAECHDILDNYILNRLADKYEDLMDKIEGVDE